MSERIRVLVVDDHLIVREGLRLILETNPQLEWVGEAGDGVTALEQIAVLRPDVVLLDLRLPGMDGIAVMERVRAARLGVAVVILTTYNEDALIAEGLRAGARGFLLKDTGRDVLFDTITAAARGAALLDPQLVARALAHPDPPSAAGQLLDLTDREQQVLRAIIAGERSKTIAVQLGISERTVKAHLASIYSKLGVDGRAAAVAVALKRGIVSLQG
jgi:two-component system, NarL family, response regulator YdfI